jgi:hypothetical protein
MVYTPTRQALKTLDELTLYVQDQLQLISQEFARPASIRGFNVSHVAPDKPRQGMQAYADGSDWNPGQGAGVYEFDGTRWVKAEGVGNGTQVFLSRLTTPQTILVSAGIPTLIDFNSTEFNLDQSDTGGTGGFEANLSIPHKWIPRAGPILMIGRAHYDGVGGATVGRALTVQLFKNGEFFAADINYISGVVVPQFLGPTVVAGDLANGGDYYQVYAEQQDTVPRILVPFATYFMGFTL